MTAYLRRLFAQEYSVDFDEMGGHDHSGLHIIWRHVKNSLPEGC